MQEENYVILFRDNEDVVNFLEEACAFVDKEAKDIFDKIIDIGNNSFYSGYFLRQRIEALLDLCSGIEYKINELTASEERDYTKLAVKYSFRNLLTTATSIFACCSNVLLGLLAFLILSLKNNKDCAEAIGSFYRVQDKREKISADSARIILENCQVQLNHKKNKTINYLNTIEDKEEVEKIIRCNYIISDYLKGYMDEEDIYWLKDDFKATMVDILKNDFRANSNDLIELLNIARYKINDEIVMTMERD